MPLREADRHLGGVEAEEQAAQRRPPRTSRRGRASPPGRSSAAATSRRPRSRATSPSATRWSAEHEEARGHGQPGEQALAARRGGRAPAGSPRRGRGRSAGPPGEPGPRASPATREARGARAARPGEPAVEEQEGEEEEERDVGAVEVAPDDGPAEGDEGAGEEPLARPREARGRRARRAGSTRGRARRRAGPRRRRAPRRGRRRRGRGRGAPCGGGSWRPVVGASPALYWKGWPSAIAFAYCATT